MPAGAAATGFQIGCAAAVARSAWPARGWTVPDWPKDYGGGGLSPAETTVLKEEMRGSARGRR